MRLGISSPIPDLGSIPGPSRPGFATGDYEFQFKVDGQVTFKANAAAGGGSFTVQWPNGSSQSYSGNNASITAPDATEGIVAINNKLDTGYCDEFAVTGGKDKVKKVISWGERPWRDLSNGFNACTNLTNIENTKLIGAANCNIGYLFFNCTGLTEALCENWDLSLGCEMRYLFFGCDNLELLNLTGSKLPGSSSAASNFSFSEVGSTTTNGCEFKMPNLNFTGTINAPGRQWFKLAKFKAGSNLSNWTFDSALNSFYATELFSSATVNGTLDVSNWNWPNEIFPSFNSVNSGLTSRNGSKIKLTNFDVSKVNNFGSAFNSCKVDELEGLSTWGACAGNASMFRMFNNATLMAFNPNDNFSNTFVASLTPTYIHEAFYYFSKDLPDSDLGPCPNLNGLDCSNLTSASTAGLLSFMRESKWNNTPDFSNTTFSSTDTVTFKEAFRSFKTIGTGSNSILNINPTTVKIANFTKTFDFAQGLTEVNIGSNVDMSSMTAIDDMFYAINNPSNNATPFTNATFPTNADFSSLTNFFRFVQAAGQILSVCQMDNFIRRLRATNDNSNITVDFQSCKITEAPALVRSDADYLTNTKSWNITLATPDATLPFQYSSYHIEPTETSVTPTVLPPLADRNFTSTNSNMPVNQTTGVITQTSGYVGNTTIRCTYADGCYNEVTIVSGYPMKFTIDTSYGSSAAAATLDVRLPFYVTGNVSDDIAISWGDNGYQTISNSQQTVTHTYPSSGSYQIRVWGQGYVFPINRFYGYLKFKSFDAWGSYIWCSGEGNLAGPQNDLGQFRIMGAEGNGNAFDYAATDAPDLSNSSTNSLYALFKGNETSFSSNVPTWTMTGNVSAWDISKVNDISYMFQRMNTANMLISGKGFENWDTRNVTNMNRMFGLYGGHGPGTLEVFQNWRTDSLTTIYGFGSYAWFANSQGPVQNYLNTKVVNEGQPDEYIAWDVSNVTNFSYMFQGNRVNLNIDNWQINTTADVSFEGFFQNGAAQTQWTIGGTSPGQSSNCASRVTANGAKTRSVTLGTTNPVTYTAWDMQKVTSISRFHQNWGGAPYNMNYLDADVSGWNLTNLKRMDQVFGNPTPQGRMGQTILPASANFSNIDSGQTVTWQYNRGGGCEDGTAILDFFYGQHANITSYTNSNVNISLNYKFQTGTTNSQYTANTGPALTGNTTLASGNNQTLYDNSKNFISLGIQVGDIAYNSTSRLYSKVVSVSTLSVGTDQAIWGTQGDAYSFETTNAAKGRYNMVNAGYNVIDGGAAPFQVQPFKFKVSVPAGTSTTITVPYVTGTDYTVNWGDQSEDNNLNTSNAAVTHTYDGTVTNPEISFGKTGDTGLPTMVSFSNAGSKTAVTEITQWGNLQFTSINYQFRGCSNLTTISATDLPDWSKVNDTIGMYLMFNDAPLNSVHSSMANWDVSMIRSFNQCFGNASGLNVDLSSWDISGVDQANGFANMFSGCSSINFDAGQWTLPTHRSDYSLTNMFANCSSFNQDLSSWDILNRVTNLANMFSGCTSFTGTNLDQWDISNVIDIHGIFRNCTSITNLDVSNWNTGNVTYMLRTFEGCSNFNPDVTNWDVSSVTGNHSMQEMFENSGLNRNLGGWQLNTSMSGNYEMYYIFKGSSMSTANYTDTIVGWANYVKNQNPDAPLNIDMSGQSSMTFDASRSGGANFANANAARNFLTDTVANGGAGWTISNDNVINIPYNSFKIKLAVTSGTEKTISLQNTGTSYTIDWGDGTIETNQSGTVSHTYNPGNTGTTADPIVSIGAFGDSGPFTRMISSGGNANSPVLEVMQWGDIAWTSMGQMLQNNYNILITATDSPDLSNCVSMNSMFNNCQNTAICTNGSMNNWDVSNINNMAAMFNAATAMNVDISSWDVSSVLSFGGMFSYAYAFNSNISGWDVSSGQYFQNMFKYATAFEVDIANWNVSSALNMQAMFDHAGTSSNTTQNLSVKVVNSGQASQYLAWYTPLCANFKSTFSACKLGKTNTDFQNWNVSSATNMRQMFDGYSGFNATTDMTPKSVTMGGVTWNAWDTSSVTTFYGFAQNSNLSQDISGWDVSAATNLQLMTAATGVDYIFDWTALNSSLTTMNYIFGGTSMSTNNYTDSIVHFANLVKNQNPNAPLSVDMGMQLNMTFDSNRSGGSNFANAFAAREFLTNATSSGGAGWTIAGDTVLPLNVSSTNSLSFNGSTEYVATTFTATGLTAMTISAYVYLDEEWESRGAITGSNWAPNDMFGFHINSDRKLDVFIRNGGANPQYLTANTAMSLGQWHHVAITVSNNGTNNSITFYLNGSVDNTTGSAQAYGQGQNFSSTTATPYNIGNINQVNSQTNFSHYKGRIDEVMIWDNVISTSNITTLANSVGSGNVPDPNSLASGVQLWNRMGD